MARRLILGGVFLAAAALCMGLMAGLGSRFGWWDFRMGFRLLKWAAYADFASLAGVISGVILAYARKQPQLILGAALGLALNLPPVVMPMTWMHTAHRAPPIHDISTDTENLPQFVDVVPLRKNALDPVEYGGPEIARQQRAAYPDLVPMILPMPSAEAFRAASAAVKELK